MSEVIPEWHSIQFPIRLDIQATSDILLVCGHRLRLRMRSSEDEVMDIQVHCRLGEELAAAESMLHQASADVILRMKIRERSESVIAEIVDGVLSGAAGK